MKGNIILSHDVAPLQHHDNHNEERSKVLLTLHVFSFLYILL